MFESLRKHQGVIGHWAMELIVVFAGVVIALTAQSWAEDRSSKLRAEAAEVRIGDELGFNIRNSLERIALDKCLKQRLATLAEGLSEGRTDWDKMRIDERDGRSLFVFDRVYRMPSRVWISSEYRGNLANGALGTLSPERTAALAGAYAQVDYQREINAEEEQLATRLAILQFGLPVSPPERAELLSALTRLDYLNGLMVLVSTQSAEHFRELHSLKPEDIKRGRKNWPAEVADMRAKYGNCVDPHAIGIIDKRLISN